MRVAIIDAEIVGKSKHRFPNLASMKLSSYYKRNGNQVVLKTNYDNLKEYDKVFISKVFTKTIVPQEVLEISNVEYGGTGFFYDKAPKLPFEIEHCKPDYSLYDEWVENCIENGAKEKEFTYYKDYSIGFLTRGCFRQCEFCVNKNRKTCDRHSPIEEFMDEDRPKLCFLDDNFFACKDWRQIIETIKETGKKFQFKQGLDERLLTEEKIKEMQTWKYDGDWIFAFDNVEDSDLIEQKLKLWRENSKNIKKTKFYLFCGFDRNDKWDLEFWKKDIEDLFKRIILLMKYEAYGYVMRYNRYEESPYRGSYINIAAWVNQPNVYYHHSYREFCIKDDARRGGIGKSSTYRYMNEFENGCKLISDKYYDVKLCDISNYKNK